ncbi:MAG: magnesium transporter [Armatimonadota bacterium]|nr:MAG: magnesium transporter [Armatimonadota bacterium]
MFYLARLLGRPVRDAEGRKVGWISDFLVATADLFPRVTAVSVASRSRRPMLVPWRYIVRLDESGAQLSAALADIEPAVPTDNEVLLGRQLLDRQIVDRAGRKVVRVNDFSLAPTDHELRLVGADVGVRGLLRRLNVERPLDRAARLIRLRLPDSLIAWNYLEPLEAKWDRLRLRMTHQRLGEMFPADLASILAQLEPEARPAVLEAIDDRKLADTLPELGDELEREILTDMSRERASDVLEMMPPDEAADVLGDMPEPVADDLLSRMEEAESRELEQLLAHPDETAGGLMTPDFVSLRDDLTVQQAMAELRRISPDTEGASYVYVVDEAGRLRGVISLDALFVAAPDTHIADIMRADVVAVPLDMDQEEVAVTMFKYNFLSLPAIDENGILRGVVTVDDALEVMQEESAEDLGRLAGAPSDIGGRRAWVLDALWRVPWLIVCAAAGLLASAMMGRAAGLAEIGWRAAAALPLVLGLSVRSASQSSAVVVRAYALGEERLRDFVIHLLGEAAAALLVGGIAGAISAAAALSWGEPAMAGALAIALPLGLVVGAVIGSVLPVALWRLRMDPAVALWPLVAVTTTLATVPIYVALLVRVSV